MLVIGATRKEAEVFAKRNAYEFEEDAADILDLMAAFAEDRVAYEETAWQDKTKELRERIEALQSALREIEHWCNRAAGEDADTDAQEAVMYIWEAARKLLAERE